jgi:ubiquinone/menaquinone biosynthesis C-methylase UbiE
MGFYNDFILPKLINLAMRNKELRPFRERVIGAAEGRVLEIGVGSGMNLPFYRAPVREVLALEPAPRLLTMAKSASRTTAIPVNFLEASAEAIPLDEHSVDTVVTTWTLCTIPNASRALAEMRRVLRPGGAFLFVEHGRAPEAGVARWQDRLDPFWSYLAGGCHLNRKVDDLVAAAGFRIETLQNPRSPGPRTHTYLYEGCARPA